MDRPKKRTRLTPEEQELKERLMRSGNPVKRKGPGKILHDFWDLPLPENPDGLLLKALLEDRRQGR